MILSYWRAAQLGRTCWARAVFDVFRFILDLIVFGRIAFAKRWYRAPDSRHDEGRAMLCAYGSPGRRDSFMP